MPGCVCEVKGYGNECQTQRFRISDGDALRFQIFELTWNPSLDMVRVCAAAVGKRLGRPHDNGVKAWLRDWVEASLAAPAPLPASSG